MTPAIDQPENQSTAPGTGSLDRDAPLASLRLSSVLLPRQEWRPYPTIDDRAAWNALPQDVRDELLRRGQDALGFEWPSLPAALYLEFAREGNRSRFEARYFTRRRTLGDLVLAECIEDQGRFLDDIANGVWAVFEDSSWVIPAHVSVPITRQKTTASGAAASGPGLPDAAEPIVDLFAAETGALLAWTACLLQKRLDQVSPFLLPRLENEVQQRFLDPCRQRDDFGWMGFDERLRPVNNWNPWINSNWLAANLLLEKDQALRLEAAEKSLRSLQFFMDAYGESGGCDEGPGYWGRAAASLFDCLDLLYSAAGGERSTKSDENADPTAAWSTIAHLFHLPKIQNMGRFIYRAHIAGNYYVNFADASAVNAPVGSLVFRYGERIGDPEMQAFGAWLFQQAGPAARIHRDSLGRILPELFCLERLAATPPAQPLPRDAWFDDIQVLVARDHAGAARGFTLAAKGGHNAESHNHNDIGNFIVYLDGLPLIVDAGVETYTRKTFSPQRYEIWTMQSAFHSLLPTFWRDGEPIMQAPGRQYATRDVEYSGDNQHARLSLDIAGAYPPEAGLKRWLRQVRLDRGWGIAIHDAFELSAADDANPGRTQGTAITLGALTPCEIGTAAPGSLSLLRREFMTGVFSAGARLSYPANLFTVRVETIPILDERLSPIWGSHLNRLIFTTRQPVRQGAWRFDITRM